jgi:transposase InsO family protein
MLLEGQKRTDMRQYLFVAIDDFPRELYVAILPDKTQGSAKKFLQQVLDECPYTIEQYYADNGKEYKGDPRHHRFMLLCAQYGIEQRFTRVRTPRTNGKAERVIRTIMELWHEKTHFQSSEHRKAELRRFVNFYNTVRPHKGIDGMTPEEKLFAYFYPEKL